LCPISYIYKLNLIPPEDHARRAVAFLISKDKKDKRVTAKAVFNNLDRNTENMLRTLFDWWIDGKINKKRFHGWSQSEFRGKYTKCFVFKLKEKKLSHRFYGFLCNPRSYDQSYQACVLVSHAFKKKRETDENNLKEIESIRTISAVQKAIKNYFRRTQ